MKKLSETPRTDEVPHNVAELAMHARKLERELAELKAIHKTAITDCQQYTPERWKEICDLQEPAAVWLDGKQMTKLMNNSERSFITAACHEEGGEVFVTDQSGNGNHAKFNPDQ